MKRESNTANWRPWLTPYYGSAQESPYGHDVVEIRRPPDGKTEMSCPATLTLHPMFNVAGLKWRPVP